MQCAQRDLAHLPDELWAQVLCNLPQEDLLTARLVSKNFIRLHQFPELKLEWQMSSPSAASSLALFVSRHLKQPGSANLEITISSSDKGLLQTSMMLACECAHLQRLRCNGELTLLQAQSSLRMLSTDLLRLSLFAPPAIMDDPAWSRLTALTALELQFPMERSSSLASGSGLALLTKLVTLDLASAEEGKEADHISNRQLKAATFGQASIRSLELTANIVQGRLDLKQFPKLEEIYFNGPLPVPTWMEGQQVKVMELWQMSQLARVDLQKLLCKHLRSYPEVNDPAWKLSDLLLLPILEKFELCRLSEYRSYSALLHGSLQEHRRFLDKVQVQLHVPARLCSDEDESDECWDLAKNGHAAICRCKECLP